MTSETARSPRFAILVVAIAFVLVVVGGVYRSGLSETLPIPAPTAVSQVRISYPAANPAHLSLPGGNEIVRSVLNVRGQMKFGEFVWSAKGVPPGPVWVRVDLGKQLISVFRSGHEIGSAVILYGANDKPSPRGQFTVLEKAQDYYSRSYDAPMPYMLRLTRDGVAIHGSYVRPGAATHGCIGVPLAFARLLFDEMRIGGAVYIEN